MKTKTTTKARKWEKFSDAELARAVELLITPDDLTIRAAATALFSVFGYTPEDVRDQLESGEYLNGGPVFVGLGTASPMIGIPASE